MSNQKRRKRILRPWARMCLICILAFFMLISTTLIYYGKNPTDKSIPSYTYNTKGDVKYKVYLKNNEFYEEEYLDENKQYPSELIDYIDIDYSYNMNGSRTANFNYSYDIIATIIGEYENSSSGRSELWKKKYTIKENQNKSLFDTTAFNVNENVKIKYTDYNKIVSNFKTKFRLAIDAYLNVKLKINYKTTIPSINASELKKDVIELNIPLTSSTVSISKNCNKANMCPKSDSKQLSKKNIHYENKKYIMTGFILLVIGSILTLLSLPALFTTNKSLYNKLLSKLMKNYSEIIIEVESLPDFNDLEVLDVKTFEDMVDIEEEIKSPIIYYEVMPNTESWFVIVTDKYVYKYTLTK